MKVPKPLNQTPIPSIFATLSKMIPLIFLFELIYKNLTNLAIKPLLSFILQFMLNISGYQLAFNADILGFFLTIPGILAGILLLALSAVFIYFEFAVIIILVHYYKQGKWISPRKVLIMALQSLKSLRNIGIIGFSVYALVLLPIVNIGITSSLLPRLSIPNFVSGELEKNAWGPALLIGFSVLVLLLFLCMIFVLPIMVLERKSFWKALKKNFQTIKASRKRLIGIYAIFLITWAVLFALPRFILTRIFNSPSVDIFKIFATFRVSWETFVLLILVVLVAITHLVLMPILLSLVTIYYLDISGVEAVDSYILVPVNEWTIKTETIHFVLKQAERSFNKIKKNKYVQKHRFIIASFLSVVFILGLLVIFNKPPALHEPIVISHRGSTHGVENTIGAIQGAIDANADYVEIDILLSSDGIPVVIHDYNLERLAGENVNVYDLTASELSEYTLSQNDYKGRISTLDEVIQYCDGKIDLAIELKLHGHEEENIVEQMMQVIQTHDFLDHCMFISLEYNLIAELNQKYPASNAGFCIYGGLGDMNNKTIMSMEIDFVVIEESMATQSTVRTLRGSWIPVYVWTVNDTANMMHYLDIGILGLVSDYPDRAREVVEEYMRTSNVVYLEEAEWKDE